MHRSDAKQSIGLLYQCECETSLGGSAMAEKTMKWESAGEGEEGVHEIGLIRAQRLSNDVRLVSG